MNKGLSTLGQESDSGIRWPELADEGWERRCVTDPSRAPELEALYQSLDFEVMLQSASPSQFSGSCEGCAASCASKIFVYTRKSGTGVNHE